MAHLADKDEAAKGPLLDWLSITCGLTGLLLAIVLSIGSSEPPADEAPPPQIEALPL